MTDTFTERQRAYREQSIKLSESLGYAPLMSGWEGVRTAHASWWIRDGPYNREHLYAAIVDALTQEGMVAWVGDGTGIVHHMICKQLDRAEKAEAELSLAHSRLAAIEAVAKELEDEVASNIERLETVEPANRRFIKGYAVGCDLAAARIRRALGDGT